MSSQLEIRERKNAAYFKLTVEFEIRREKNKTYFKFPHDFLKRAAPFCSGLRKLSVLQKIFDIAAAPC